MAMTTTTLRFASMPWVLLAALAGCSQERATLLSWRAPAAPLPQTRTVAVLPLAGPTDQAEAARHAVYETLVQGELYQVAPPAAVAATTAETLYHDNGVAKRAAAIQLGRQLNVDAVVVGHVRFEDGKGRPLGSAAVGFGVRQTVAVVDFEVVDVRSGIATATGHESETYFGELSERSWNSKQEDQILLTIAQKAGQKAAGQIVPSLKRTDVELANDWMGSGAGHVRSGNRLARAGRWEDAKVSWEKAVAANPGNPAALYNLGLGEEALGNYSQARCHFQRALEIDDKPLYQTAANRSDEAVQEAARIAQLTAPVQPPIGYASWPAGPTGVQRTAAPVAAASYSPFPPPAAPRARQAY